MPFFDPKHVKTEIFGRSYPGVCGIFINFKCIFYHKIIHHHAAFSPKSAEEVSPRLNRLSRQAYLKFLEKFFFFLKKISKKNTRLAFINSDWRNFQNCPADKEDPGQSILVVDYYKIFKKTGWTLTHIIQVPLSSERFNAGVVSAMQKKKILGVISRYVMILQN
jgi:hypothetical protein